MTSQGWIPLSFSRAITLGLAAGLAEAALRLGRSYIFGHAQIYTGRDIIWMAPLADVIAFVIVTCIIVALLALLGKRVSPGAKLALATGALVALAVWSMGERVPPIGRTAAAILGLGAGAFAWQSARRFATSRVWLDRLLVPLGTLVTALGAVQIGRDALRERRALAALPATSDGMPNVLLLILDTVRAQSTSVHGHTRPTTPRLAALADSGVRFDNAFVTAPWTLPSHASMFTGRYPHELSVDWLTPLDAADTTLAERFSAAGYVTGGFVGNYMVSREPGIARGFAHYDDFQRNVEQLAMSSALASWLGHWTRLRRALGWYEHVNRKQAHEVNAGVVRWIRERGNRPYFAFVNYFDAHEFYLPPAPFATMFGSDTARKNWNIGFSLPNGGTAYRSNKMLMKPHEVRAELDAYEAAIAHLDSQVGALLDSLNGSAALANTIIVVTSDHGELFGEHRKFGHGSSLYPQVLRVPLVIYAPGRVPQGVHVREQVTLRDLAATIEGVALGSARLPGSSLSAYWDRDAATRSTSAIRKPDPDSVRHGMWAAVIDEKLVIEFVGGANLGTEVFDLRADPLALRAAAIGPTVQSAVDSATRLYRGMTWRSRAVASGRD
ncbi:MAG: sulfatase-like hydrolase/transferase [Gemmatimonadaceae bacterium]